MNEKYKDAGSLTIRLLEECGELIKAISKAERFGWNNFHPDNFPCHSKPKEEWCDYKGKGGFMGHTCGKPKTNLDDIQCEIDDINRLWLIMIGGENEEEKGK